MKTISAWLGHIVVALVLLAFVGMASPATAGEEASDSAGVIDCDKCYQGMGSQYYHHGMNGGGGDNVNVDCEVGDGCHTGSEPGACIGGSDEHERCEATLEEDASTILRELTAAIDAHDIGSIRQRLDRERIALRINADRKALQLIDCQGAIIAHLPLGDDLTHLLAVSD